MRSPILGINAYHGDSSACIIADGKLIAAAEEERFNRVKHWAGLPVESIRYCLNEAGMTLEAMDYIAVNRNPNANILKKVLFTFKNRPNLRNVQDRLDNTLKVRGIREALARSFFIPSKKIKARIHEVEHHRAHMASAYFVSHFNEASIVSVDGFGDFVSAMWGVGEGNRLIAKDSVYFPHSLGLFYLAMTQFLGFSDYGDEYKVMGLSAYGKPAHMNEIKQIVLLKPKGKFELNLDYFLHHAEGVSMVWEGGRPVIGTVYSKKMEEIFGPPRKPGEAITELHKNIAASIQRMYEEAFFHFLNYVYTETKMTALCLAGGCAMNSVANGKIFLHTPFRNLFIQPAAGDAGGAIGAAYYVWNHELKQKRTFVMAHSHWGPQFSRQEIQSQLDIYKEDFQRQGFRVDLMPDLDSLCQTTARAIADGKVVGWFQGRMEWGPRALGNRSILCDPRRADIRDFLNLKIKRREAFRPFAPSILRHRVGEWFEEDADVPFMLQVYSILPDKQKQIPAVTHVNGSGRLQTVTEDQNPLYYRLILEFEKITGIPMLLNTSFNENEPIVCKPSEAIECFLRTNMDILVLGDYILLR